jgi:hypothetical protein
MSDIWLLLGYYSVKPTLATMHSHRKVNAKLELVRSLPAMPLIASADRKYTVDSAI